MNVKARACQFQRRRIQEQTKQMDANEFFNLLTSTELFDVLEQHLPEHRERRYPPTETLSMFLSQAMSADRSCQNVVNTSEVKRAVAGLPRQNTYTGSYCKARQRLPVELIKALARHTGQALGKITPREWLQEKCGQIYFLRKSPSDDLLPLVSVRRRTGNDLHPQLTLKPTT